ncbi:hypothetical protein [Actinomadura parmotrematis]|uniref:hypothetical protein n=1 Tax=Actinomadura parmotrematis TaxID=2864039 RepID=UPI00215D936E|nr:hypothetical protein [Actinomadura parmotrematis]
MTTNGVPKHVLKAGTRLATIFTLFGLVSLGEALATWLHGSSADWGFATFAAVAGGVAVLLGAYMFVMVWRLGRAPAAPEPVPADDAEPAPAPVEIA